MKNQELILKTLQILNIQGKLKSLTASEIEYFPTLQDAKNNMTKKVVCPNSQYSKNSR